MKKILAAAAVLMLCLSAGCGKKTSKASELPADTETTTTTTAEAATEPTTLLTDMPSTTVTTVTSTVTTTKTTTSTTTAKPQQPDPLGGNVFSLNKDGAVVFSEDSSTQDDTVLISAAQALFESACRTEWSYTVSCPYELDPNDYVENEFGWQFHRIKNEGINSMANLRADYNKVFSGRYPDQLSELYIEDDGSLYALDAARGRDLYYMDSIITGVAQKKSDEIVFTVEHHYSGSDEEPTQPVTLTEEFSAVIENGSTWKAGEFRLPY